MKKVLIIITFIIASFIILYHTSYAKYVANSIWDYYLNSNKFYFESDYLNSESKNNIYNSWDGNSISFNIKNSLNNELYTKDDISYIVTCSIENSNEKCLINGEEKYQALLKGNKISNDILSFEIPKDIDVAKVNVIAKAIYPYKKTLKATFELNKSSINESISYDIENHTNYSSLNISNYLDNEKCLHISFYKDNIKILQNKSMMNIETDDNGYINAFDINVKAKDTISINVYNEDVISKDDFTVLQCQ